MINNFDSDVAIDVGVNAAIIYKNIQFWCEKNQTNGLHEHDGLYWTYNSVKAFCMQFPYMSDKQIRTALNTLEEKGYIVSGNFNKSTYDRTKWYADNRAKRFNSSCPTGQMEIDNRANENAPEGEPIPDINTDVNTDVFGICNMGTQANGNDLKPKNTRFVPPTVEQVQAYCDERGNDVDAQHFIDYYTARGWKMGKNSVKDWKACVRTWERNSYNKPVKLSGYSGNEFAAIAQSMGDDND